MSSKQPYIPIYDNDRWLYIRDRIAIYQQQQRPDPNYPTDWDFTVNEDTKIINFRAGRDSDFNTYQSQITVRHNGITYPSCGDYTAMQNFPYHMAKYLREHHAVLLTPHVSGWTYAWVRFVNTSVPPQYPMNVIDENDVLNPPNALRAHGCQW